MSEESQFDLTQLLAKWRKQEQDILAQIDSDKRMELSELNIWHQEERASAIRKCIAELEQTVEQRRKK